MRKLLTIFAAFAALTAAATDTEVRVTLTNPSSTARKAVPVVIDVDKTVTTALVTLNGKEIP